MFDQSTNKQTYFKDNVFGYIKIDKEIVDKIVNSKSFQRLRNIEQSNLHVLYPSSKITRFAHSLGVYYLSKFTTRSLLNNFVNFKDSKTRNADFSSTLEKACRDLEMAALLHDLGHAPFSHLTEDTFSGEMDKESNIFELERVLFSLYEDLFTTVSKSFQDDYCRLIKSNRPKPHEVLSCISLLKDNEIYEFLCDEKYGFDLIIRCILGCKYEVDYSCTTKDSKDIEIKKTIKNCVIEILNSETIDIDKLDYLLRDSYVSGYESSNIDYRRILSSIILFFNEKSYYRLVYNKKGISVIDNIHNALRNQQMWLFNHPAVVLDNYLKKHCISKLIFEVENNEKKLFSYKSIIGRNQINKSLLVDRICDYDVMYLLKNQVNNIGAVKQLFDRRLRFKPIWKSYFDVQVYLSKKDVKFKYLSFFTHLNAYLSYCKNTLSREVDIDSSYFSEGADSFYSFLQDYCEYMSINFSDVLLLGTNNVMKRELSFIENDINIYYKYSTGSEVILFSDLMKRNKKNESSILATDEYDLNGIDSNKLKFYLYKNIVNVKTEEINIISFFDYVKSHKTYQVEKCAS